MSDELKFNTVQPAKSAGEMSENQLPGEGRLPWKAGEVKMTDYTRRNLQALGWKDGDPIPTDLGVKLREIQAEIQAERSTVKIEDSELAANWKPVAPKMVEISDLPEAKQAELRQHLENYKVQFAQEEQERAAMAELEAQIPDSVQGDMRDKHREMLIQEKIAQQERRQRQQAADTGPQAEMIDDRIPENVKPPEGKQFTASLGNASSLPAKMEAIKRAQEQAAKQQAPAAVEAEPTGAMPVAHICSRCHWDNTVTFDLEITDDDRKRFVVANESLQRFEKKYTLLRNLELIVRSLTANEQRQVTDQLSADIRDGKIYGDGEYFAWLNEYRLVLSVSRLQNKNITVLAIPIYADWLAANPGKTLNDFREYFYTQVDLGESLRRIIGSSIQHFQRLTEALEAQASKPDF